MPADWKTLWTETSAEDGTPQIAARIAAVLRAAGPFRLWLVGDLGAGKTHLTGEILRAMGLDQRFAVTSPTYTYCNEYPIGTEWYAHLDLYRAGPGMSLEDLGLVDARDYRGYFVEWPEQVPEHPVLEPDFLLRIEFTEGGTKRTYVLTEKPRT